MRKSSHAGQEKWYRLHLSHKYQISISTRWICLRHFHPSRHEPNADALLNSPYPELSLRGTLYSPLSFPTGIHVFDWPWHHFYYAKIQTTHINAWYTRRDISVRQIRWSVAESFDVAKIYPNYLALQLQHKKGLWRGDVSFPSSRQGYSTLLMSTPT